MDIHRTRAVLLVAGITLVFALTGCSAAAERLFGAAASTTAPASTATVLHATTPAAQPSESVASRPSPTRGSTGAGPGPGAVACGPVTATETIAICLPAGQQPLAIAAEQVLTSSELAIATGARVDQGPAMCAVVPAKCSGTPPVALVIFERSGASDWIRVLVWRTTAGGLSATRM